MSLLLRRHVSYGPFLISNNARVGSLEDPLEPCRYYADVRAILEDLLVDRRRFGLDTVSFVVFVEADDKVITVLSTSSPAVRHGRALYIDLPAYKHDVIAFSCGVACVVAVMGILAWITFL